MNPLLRAIYYVTLVDDYLQRANVTKPDREALFTIYKHNITDIDMQNKSSIINYLCTELRGMYK